MVHRLAIRFAIQGDLRFISHHDTVRLFERALARADIPVRRSGGFNPRPRVSLPLPRSVGIASQDELLVVELSTAMSCDEAIERLATQLPVGIRLNSAIELSERCSCLPLAASYSLPLEPDEVPQLSERASEFMSGGVANVSRHVHKTGRERTIDVRAFVTEAGVQNGQLRWTQTITQSGTTKPAEVLTALGIDPGERTHRIERTSVVYDVSSPPNETN